MVDAVHGLHGERGSSGNHGRIDVSGASSPEAHGESPTQEFQEGERRVPRLAGGRGASPVRRLAAPASGLSFAS